MAIIAIIICVSLIIQKVVIKDTIEHLVNLDSTEEYKKAFQKFIEQK